MRKVVLASGNQGKLREFAHLFSSMDIEVLQQSAFNVPEADETGLSFVENAILKARNAAQHTGLPAIADDSGIEVDALQGSPGIYSARYAGIGASDTANLNALLTALKDVPEKGRTARYQCLLVYMRHAEDPTPLICQGSWEGRILTTPVGDGGFGYDPIFWVDEKQCSAAQLTANQKHALSHRGKAMRQFMTAFQANITTQYT
ncbi:MAG: non-canonical purine NTP pyrophosphatase, RdgB/HAM1 family [Gammaproteobacteria bacterium]|nr:MAG: non-canonical purine NTP pyrophosphatase, RdgB/HAM1 family [Gammaproteobacteria bacterium]